MPFLATDRLLKPVDSMKNIEFLIIAPSALDTVSIGHHWLLSIQVDLIRRFSRLARISGCARFTSYRSHQQASRELSPT